MRIQSCGLYPYSIPIPTFGFSFCLQLGSVKVLSRGIVHLNLNPLLWLSSSLQLASVKLFFSSISSQIHKYLNHLTMASTSQESQQSHQIKLPDPLTVMFLEKITNGFSSEKLGESVFGTVYKGTTPDGKIISVKKLHEKAPVAHGETFNTEVTNLKALKHKYIVELLGSCPETPKEAVPQSGRDGIVDTTEYFVCYEYLANGSLDKHLYGALPASDETDHKIEWDKRFKIVKGICQGLHFLHTKGYVHMNLVPNTIWLDDNWEPKIADFGLSRLFDQQTTITTDKVLGHYGYMAPEYLYRGEISTLSDIYSLGMLIIEIVTGQKIDANNEDKSARNFVEKVRQDWMTDDQIKSKCPSLDTKRLQQMKTCIAIGLKCVDVEQKNRPSIGDIVDKLEGKRVPFFDEGSGLQNA